MAQEERAPSEDMKKGLLHWFNTVGSGGFGGQRVDSLADLWREHVPALLEYLKNECKNLKGVQGESANQVYEDAMAYMQSSTESEHMAASLNATAAANGSELEISKFLLLFWHELCISDSKTMEDSIEFLEQVNLQDTMGNAIAWMNKATENQDYNRWFDVLFETPMEDEEPDARTPVAKTPVDAGDAKTPIESFDRSIERKGEDTFTFTTPSNIPMRHSFYERDVSSMRNSLMMTPRLSARRQLPVPSSEPRPFIAPHPVTRGSPIADQLHSPAMREKRREREMRSLQHKLSLAQEDRDAKEIELNKVTHNIHELYESNRLLKEKVNDLTTELAKESRIREETERDFDELRKERGSLAERIDELSGQVKKWKHDYELSIGETSRLTERIEELEEKLFAKSREIVDVKDEVKAKTMALEEARESNLKEKKNVEELKLELSAMTENVEEMKEDWRKRLKENENQMIEIESSNHAKIGEMNEHVMKKESELKKANEELEMERRKGEELRRRSDDEKRLMREGMEKERSEMMEEMRDKKMKLERLEEEREKMDKESGEKTRELMKKLNEMELKNMEMDATIISLKQRLSVANSNGDCLAQEVADLKSKDEVLERMSEQLKETIEEMEAERMIKERELSRMREVEEMNSTMKGRINQLMKEKEEANEKAYAAMLENDKFTAMIEKMRRDEEERIKEQDCIERSLRSEIFTANKNKEDAEEKLRHEKKEREEEKRTHEDNMKPLMADHEQYKSLKFVHKNEMKKLKGLENELKKNEEINKQNGEMKENIGRLEKELENLKEATKENMDNVVAKKRSLELELSKKENVIDKLNEDILHLKERIKEVTVNDTSMTTVRDDMRGIMIPERTLMDFDEEPTQLEAKTNLSAINHGAKENAQVSYHDNQRPMERITEDKENDGLMTPLVNNRRQLPPMDSNRRVMDIADRNAKTMPHLRSHHAVEQMSPNFSQEGLKEGVVRPSSSKKLSSAFRSRFTMGKK